MIKIDRKLIGEVSAKAKQSTRNRINYNFHKIPSDTLQRMLNAMQPGTYLQPHKHENPDKREVFIALTGRFVVIQFNDDGSIADYMILDPKRNDCAAEVAERTYHTIICLDPDSVIYELKDGPYDTADDKHFASWAPKEGESGCDTFINKILSELNLKISR